MSDIYQKVTDKIIAELEQGTAPWVRPWSSGIDPQPRNAASGRAYSGINNLMLNLQAAACGYETNEWLTFRQALQLGGHVRKGEKSSSVIFYEPRIVESDPDDPVADGTRRVPLLKVFNVFNRSQVEGLSPIDRPPVHEPFDSCVMAEQIIDGSGASILYQGFRAFYSPTKDQITLPARHHFAGSAEFYGTALHELAHWSGHPARLGREFGKRFGDSAYSAEELVAELSSAFLAAYCRIDGQLQHAAYLGSWLTLMRQDAKAIFVAAGKAQQAADFLLAKAGLIEQSAERQAA